MSFLLLAALPAAVLTVFALLQTSGSLERLQNPGVERSVRHAAWLSRELMDGFRERADDALALVSNAQPDEPIRATLTDTEFDFVLFHDPDGLGTARIVARGEAPVPSTAFVTENDWRDAAAGRVPALIRDSFLVVFSKAPLPGRAVGLRLTEETALALNEAELDFARYQQLSVFEEIQKRVVWILSAALFLLLIFVAFGVARFTARRISRPVEELSQAASAIAAGDLSRRASVRAEGEIGDLVDSFNHMGAELQRAQQELIRVERVAAWRQVAQRIAHEVRNPLTPIRLAAHRLQKRIPDDESARECLRSIAEEVETLQRLSESFSTFAKFPEPEFTPLDVAQIAKSVVDLFQESQKGTQIVFRGESQPLTADRDGIRRALTNLIKNALEALEGTGTVEVDLSGDENGVKLSVTDDGPGIPPELADSLDRPGVSGKTAGSGLGLALVQRIAMDHGGTLHWETRHPGARFVLELPRTPSDRPRS